ncbi:hypothetical protein [Sphingobacterium hungaricum]
MTKYTINKAFQRKFPAIIWKIEVDNQQKYIAVETREPDSTDVFISVIAFNGNPILLDYPLLEKDWTLDSIQSTYLIFKKIGENTPTKEGLLILDFVTKQEILRSYEYSLLDVYTSVLKVKHRLFASGMDEYIQLESGQKIQQAAVPQLTRPTNNIAYPYAIEFQKPAVLDKIDYDGSLWMSKLDDLYLWCFHQKQHNGYNLKLCISDLNQILVSEVILEDLEKQIPQPYFQVGNQIFLMSYNKQEIVSYLV